MKHTAVRRARPFAAFAFLIGLLMAMLPGAANASVLVEPDDIVAFTPESNSADYWEQQEGEVCTKVDDAGADTNYTVPAPDEGYGYTKIIVKQALLNYIFLEPEEGDVLDSTGGYSHVIACVMPVFVFEPGLDVTKDASASYDRTVTWDITKSVDPASHSGYVGDTFTSNYVVAVDKSEAEDNFAVTGNITVTNGSNATLTVDSVTDSLDDGTVATVDCSAVPDMELAPTESLQCTYSASPSGRTATLNTATASASGFVPPGYLNSGDPLSDSDSGTADVTYVENLIGYDAVTVQDVFNSGAAETLGTAGDDTSFQYTRNFTCTEEGTSQYPNTASIVETGQSDDAMVTVVCEEPEVWVGETATGFGTDWAKNSNWFMFTPFTTAKVDLIAGQYYDAGDIFMTRNGTTSIDITLHDGFRFAAVDNNVKVQPLTSCDANQKYIQPGQYAYKQTASGGSASVSGLPNALCYAIHVDVERLVH